MDETDQITRAVIGDLSGPKVPPEDDVVELSDALDDAAQALPALATLTASGAVRLDLGFPVKLRSRDKASDAVVEEQFTTLLLRRLNGADMAKVLAAKGARAAAVALGRASGLSPAKVAVLYERMDASDVAAANDVVAYLCGFDSAEGLPPQAERGDDGSVTLALRYPAEPQGFMSRSELVMKRLTGGDLIAIAQSENLLATAIARSTGLTPREALALFEAMDAADIMAANRVVRFFSSSGPRTGR